MHVPATRPSASARLGAPDPGATQGPAPGRETTPSARARDDIPRGIDISVSLTSISVPSGRGMWGTKPIEAPSILGATRAGPLNPSR